MFTLLLGGEIVRTAVVSIVVVYQVLLQCVSIDGILISGTAVVQFSSLDPFGTAVPFWGQTTQISSSLSPQRDCGSERG